ncbi:MAG: DUF2938 domain-containing protein [Giesbergeria sp.]|nr:DUF2938 domain-containing protein [Giesbergeria sp.]
MPSLHDLVTIALVGTGATAVLDAWLVLLQRLGVPTMNFALLGRWVGHGLHGRWRHAAMAQAAPVQRERALGWLSHYLIGIVFAGVLVGLLGTGWLRAPTLVPAFAFGVGTVAVPLFVMQPAMGLGFAAAKTPAPLKNCTRSVANHAVFGAGLYLAATLVHWVGL